MLYGCKWPNGDVSFVLADSRIDAVINLDYVWGAMASDVFPISNQGLMSINLRRIDTSEPLEEGTPLFELKDFGEGMKTFLENMGIALIVPVEPKILNQEKA